MARWIVARTIFVTLATAGSVRAEFVGPPDPADVSHITVAPHDDKLADYFTPDSLMQALPHLRRTEFGRTLAFGKVWLWQKGVIHLQDGTQIPWRSFADNLILFDTAEGPVVYTDISAQTHFYRDGKIIMTIHTWQGPREITIGTQ
jgi:hypothetical protein